MPPKPRARSPDGTSEYCSDGDGDFKSARSFARASVHSSAPGQGGTGKSLSLLHDLQAGGTGPQYALEAGGMLGEMV